jgi:2-methylisocitrate lyase-like PEP mutase family enzyme
MLLLPTLSSTLGGSDDDSVGKPARFRELHDSGCFVIPNPWDVGSAKMQQALGFPAVASTSSGFAWSTGRLDNEVPLDDMLAHLTALLSAAVDIPLDADFENGHADAPETWRPMCAALDASVAKPPPARS